MAKNIRLTQRERVALEATLLAEEKMVITCLNKVKEYRNSLQIERLHLENLKRQILAQMKDGNKTNTIFSSDPVPTAVVQREPSPVPSTSSKNPTLTVPVISNGGPDMFITSLRDFDGPMAGIDNDMINTEELNLAVTNSVFNHQDAGEFDMEEEEDDCLIDMNMFMYGKDNAG